jgi:hypothetical protein
MSVSTIRMYQTYNSQYARPDDESSYSAPMPIDTFLPFLKDKYDDVTGEGSFDVEINVPLESINREWLEGLAAGSTTNLNPISMISSAAMFILELKAGFNPNNYVQP